MPWGDRHFTVIAALALAAGSALAHADPPGYGKVDTFEPGKKYSCVPSADHKSWDCTQSGKAATTNSASPPHDEPAAAKPANPQAAASVAPPPAAPASTPAASAPRSSELPSYLKASSASPPAAAPGPIAAPPPVPVPAAARAPAPAATPGPVAAAEAQTSTNPRSAPVAAAPPPPAPPLPAAKPTSTSVGATEPRSAAGPARVPAPAPPHAGANASNGNHSFLDLPGDHYVIELAHSEREADADAARAALHLPRGEVYELHLRQNGTDAWLLVWGSFDDVGAARAARGELPADVHAGWPRRVSPLQAEVRRAEQP